MTNITEIIAETKQDWKVTIGNQKKEAPYLLIDNWYTAQEQEEVWYELDMFSTQPDKDKADDQNSPVARGPGGEARSNAWRFHVWDFYTQEGLKMSPIHRCLYKQRSKAFHDLVQKAMPLHKSNFVSTNKDATFISYYDKAKYYKPHCDTVQFTCLIWMYKEPKQFFGGNLRLTAADTTIECVNNRMLIFPGYLEHEVTEVKSKDNIKMGHGRYCITHFYNWESSCYQPKHQFDHNF